MAEAPAVRTSRVLPLALALLLLLFCAQYVFIGSSRGWSLSVSCHSNGIEKQRARTLLAERGFVARKGQLLANETAVAAAGVQLDQHLAVGEDLNRICISVVTHGNSGALRRHRLLRLLRDAKRLAGAAQSGRYLYLVRTDIPALVCKMVAAELGTLAWCEAVDGRPVLEKAGLLEEKPPSGPCDLLLALPSLNEGLVDVQKVHHNFAAGDQTVDRGEGHSKMEKSEEQNSVLRLQEGGGLDLSSEGEESKARIRMEKGGQPNDRAGKLQLPSQGQVHEGQGADVDGKDDSPLNDICVSVTIGDSSSMPSSRALQYSKVLKLFRKAREVAVQHPSMVKKRIHIGVDLPGIVCRMARDELPKGTFSCQSYFVTKKRKSLMPCDVLIAGRSQSTDLVYQDPKDLGRTRWPKVQRPILWVDVDANDYTVPVIANPRRTIVTSVSDNHFDVVFRFLRSVDYYCPPGICNWDVVVYDMLLKAEYRSRLDCLVEHSLKRIKTEIRTFDFSKWPSWMNVSVAAGEYAWKAVMVKEVLDETGNALWMDGGNRVTSVESMLAVFKKYEETHESGFYCPGHSGGLVKDWTHPLEVKYLRGGEFLELKNCNAAIIGFTLKAYENFLWPWYECSITRQCIAPEGSSRKNHRQDQAALTLIAALNGQPCVDHSEITIHWDEYHYEDNITATQC